MGMPLPYQAGLATGNQFGKAMRASGDKLAIDDILAQAKSQGPEYYQDAIGKILSNVSPERQQQALQAIQAIDQRNEQRRQQALKQQEYAKYGLSPQLSEGINQEIYKQRAYDNELDRVFGGGQPSISGGQSNLPYGGIQSPQQPPYQEKPLKENMPQGGKSLIMENMPDEMLVRLSAGRNKGIAEAAKEQLKINSDNRKSRIKFGQEIGKKVIEKADEIAESLPQKEAALRLMNNSIQNGDLEWWSLDNLADATGIEGLRSSEGALFKTAAKEYFLGNISRAGARPNQWIEQQIQDMMPKIGRSTEANLSVSRALENEIDLEKERVRLVAEISDEIEAGDGNYRKLGARVNEKLSKYASAKQNELFNDLRAINSISEGKPQSFQKVTKGTKVSPYIVDALLIKFNNDDKRAIKEAEKLGYVYE